MIGPIISRHFGSVNLICSHCSGLYFAFTMTASVQVSLSNMTAGHYISPLLSVALTDADMNVSKEMVNFTTNINKHSVVDDFMFL